MDDLKHMVLFTRALIRELLPAFERPRNATSGYGLSSGMLRNSPVTQVCRGEPGARSKNLSAYASCDALGGLVSQRWQREEAGISVRGILPEAVMFGGFMVAELSWIELRRKDGLRWIICWFDGD